MLKKLANIFKWAIFYLIVTVGLFEIIYRFDWIDFYSTELKGLNDLELTNDSTKKNFLIFGDSFSADQNSYIKHLKNSSKNFNIINSAVPGTSMFHHKRFLKRRVATFKPSAVLFQLYIGNDFIDYTHPINWKQLSLARNSYWLITDYLISLQYLNYKSGQFKASKTFRDAKIDSTFSVDSYNAREKLYYKADSNVLQKSIEGNHSSTSHLMNDLNDAISSLPDSVDVYVLIIPHAAQASEKNRENIQKLGAYLNNDIKNINYGVIELLKKEIKRGEILSPLKEFQKNGDCYYPNDPHLNPKGQKILANYLLEKIDLF